MTFAQINLELIRAAIAPPPIVCARGPMIPRPDWERLNVLIGLMWMDEELWL